MGLKWWGHNFSYRTTTPHRGSYLYFDLEYFFISPKVPSKSFPYHLVVHRLIKKWNPTISTTPPFHSIRIMLLPSPPPTWRPYLPAFWYTSHKARASVSEFASHWRQRPHVRDRRVRSSSKWVLVRSSSKLCAISSFLLRWRLSKGDSLCIHAIPCFMPVCAVAVTTVAICFDAMKSFGLLTFKFCVATPNFVSHPILHLPNH